MPLTALILLYLMLPVAIQPGGGNAPSPDGTELVRQMLADAPPFTGAATPKAAAFLLGIPERSVWEWNLPETLDDDAEYIWEVGVNNDGREYRFGFGLYKLPGDSYRQGDLEQLLHSGQSDLWLKHSERSGASVVRGVRIRVEPHKTGQILVLVEGREIVEMLLSSRPEQVTGSMFSPYEVRDAIINMTYPEASGYPLGPEP